MKWRKASYSNPSGNCAEVSQPERLAEWRKPSRSNSQGACFEVAEADGIIALRDSKDPHGPQFHFSASAWRAYTERIKAS
jgi:hypothetical protein